MGGKSDRSIVITAWIAAVSAALAVLISVVALLASMHATNLAEREDLKVSDSWYDLKTIPKIISPRNLDKPDVGIPALMPLNLALHHLEYGGQEFVAYLV